MKSHALVSSSQVSQPDGYSSYSSFPPTATVPVTGNGHPMFYEILNELAKLHSVKNADYATKADPLSNFNRVGHIIGKFLKPGVNQSLAACLSLMAKQVDAVYEFVGEGKTHTFEALDDKLKDIAVYSVIAMIIAREAQKQADCGPDVCA